MSTSEPNQGDPKRRKLSSTSSSSTSTSTTTTLHQILTQLQLLEYEAALNTAGYNEIPSFNIERTSIEDLIKELVDDVPMKKPHARNLLNHLRSLSSNPFEPSMFSTVATGVWNFLSATFNPTVPPTSSSHSSSAGEVHSNVTSSSSLSIETVLKDNGWEPEKIHIVIQKCQEITVTTLDDLLGLNEQDIENMLT